MAIIKVKVISIIGRLSELDLVTQVCGKSRVFHPDNAMDFYTNTENFMPMNDENPYAAPLQQLLGALKSIGHTPSLLSEEETDRVHLKMLQAFRYTGAISRRITRLLKEREALRREIVRCEQDAEDAAHFVGLTVDLEKIRACQFITLRFGSLPRAGYNQLQQHMDNPYVTFFPCTSDDKTLWGVYICPLEQAPEIDRLFSGLYFQQLHLADFDGTPAVAVEQYRLRARGLREQLRELEKKAEALWKAEQHRCEAVFSWLTARDTFFGIRRYAAQYNDCFILSGWIPSDEEDRFTTQLDGIKSVEYSLDPAENELAHSPPVRLKNHKPAKPFEYFVEMYGLPSYSEVDPTPLVAFIFILLFGIMFGDLGQGVCVSLVGLWMCKKRKMPLGRILIPCGISSCFFGLVFGSVFGFEDLLNPLYQAMGFSEKPISVMEPATTNEIIIFAVGIGFVLMVIAMGINIVSSLRQRHYERALFGPNGIAGLVFYMSLVLGCVLQMTTGVEVMTLPVILGLIVLPLLVLFFREVLGGLLEGRKNWKPESWGEFFIQNFFELFEFLLSYLSNTVSFLRVGAFVLVHAGMMSMVFTLAEMLGGAGYPIAVVLGNIFVMVMEGLLVSIHVLRLNFYEMFSRFYDGDGRPFAPVEVRSPEYN